MDAPTATMFSLLGQAVIAGSVTVVLVWMSQRTKNAVDKNTTITKNVHALVNNAMGVQLKTTANALRALAHMTNQPGDIKAADEAMRLWQDHMSGQEAIDKAVEEKIESNPLLPSKDSEL